MDGNMFKDLGKVIFAFAVFSLVVGVLIGSCVSSCDFKFRSPVVFGGGEDGDD